MSQKWKWNIREALPEDIPFIYSTWLNTAFHHGGFKGEIGKHTFYCSYPPVIDKILADPDTVIAVACSVDDPNVVFGYLVATNGIAHFANVKGPFQKYGIARSLHLHLRCGPKYTHTTRIMREIRERHPELKFDPSSLPHLVITNIKEEKV